MWPDVRKIVALAWPVLIGQLAIIAFGVIDTAMVGRFSATDLAALGLPSLDSYVDAYVARTGLEPRAHLPVYFAYNFFRIAAILQGIAGRVRDGTATSALAAEKAQLVRPLAVKAWEFAQAAGA